MLFPQVLQFKSVLVRTETSLLLFLFCRFNVADVNLLLPFKYFIIKVIFYPNYINVLELYSVLCTRRIFVLISFEKFINIPFYNFCLTLKDK
jgi:hypothetical protein